MPGFAEHAVKRGFAAHKPAARGFAQYASTGYSYEHPAVGFGAALKQYEADRAAAARPTRKRRPPRAKRPDAKPLQWPVGSVGKLINYRETPDWKNFPDGIPVTSRGKQVGKRIAPGFIALEYFTSQELNSALTARYSRLAYRDDKKGAASRADIVETFAAKLDTLVTRLRKAEDQEYVDTVGAYERTELMARRLGAAAYGGLALTTEEDRFLDMDYEAYDKDDLVAQMLLSRNDCLWQPGTFEIGDLEGAGPGRLGLRVLDPHRIHRNERRELMRVFSEEFGFQSRFFSRDWTPQLIIASDVPPAILPQRVDMPALPIDIALYTPRHISKH